MISRLVCSLDDADARSYSESACDCSFDSYKISAVLIANIGYPATTADSGSVLASFWATFQTAMDISQSGTAFEPSLLTEELDEQGAELSCLRL